MNWPGVETLAERNGKVNGPPFRIKRVTVGAALLMRNSPLHSKTAWLDAAMSTARTPCASGSLVKRYLWRILGWTAAANSSAGHTEMRGLIHSPALESARCASAACEGQSPLRDRLVPTGTAAFLIATQVK